MCRASGRIHGIGGNKTVEWKKIKEVIMVRENEEITDVWI